MIHPIRRQWPTLTARACAFGAALTMITGCVSRSPRRTPEAPEVPEERVDRWVFDEDTTIGFAGTHENTEVTTEGLALKTWSAAERPLLPGDATFDTSGLVALWSFDDTSWSGAGTVSEATGTYAASAIGATQAPGILGSAASLDGIDDEVRVDGSVVPLSRAPWEDFSIAAWVKTADDCAGNSFFVAIAGRGGAGGASGAGIAIGCDASGGAILLTQSDTANIAFTSPSHPINDDAWHHVVGVKRGDIFCELEIWVDGGKRGSTNGTTGPCGGSSFTFGANDTLTIGSVQDGAGFTSGLIDEVSIWHRALDGEEISHLYQRQRQGGTFGGGAVGVYTSPLLEADGFDAIWQTIRWTPRRPYGVSLPDDGAKETVFPEGNADMTDNVLLYHMDGINPLQNNWPLIIDSSGHGHTGLGINASGTVAFVPGPFGPAISLGLPDLIVIPDAGTHPDFSPGTGDFTWALWAWPLPCGGTWSQNNRIYLGGGDGSDAPHIWLGGACGWCNNGAAWVVRDDLRQGPTIACSNETLDTTRWHHFVGVKRGHGTATPGSTVADTMLYLDGELVDTTSFDFAGSFQFDQGQIHMGSFSSLSGYLTRVILDEVAIWNRALSATEIRDLFLRGVMVVALQARSCDGATGCDIEPFVGPERNPEFWFSVSFSLTDWPVETPLAWLYMPKNPLFQFRVGMFTSDSSATPVIGSFAVEAVR